VTAPTTGSSGELTQLPAGLGRVFRRELTARSIFAGVLTAVALGAFVYGANGLAAGAEIGLAFVIFGAAGALAQAMLALAMVRVRRAISGDTYRTTIVLRTRRAVEVTLMVLGAGAVAVLVITAASARDGLAGGTALGLAADFALAIEGWRVFWRLGSHAGW
jgi:hypothetical protein